MKFIFLKPEPNWEGLYFYQKSVVLYLLTYAFAKRYLQRGDRTIDQMVQAARSGKQNIVEGSADSMTSTRMELELVNVARASLKELREDYEDYLDTRHLRWTKDHPRYTAMMEFTRKNNKAEAYKKIIDEGTNEEMANLGLTLTHQVDCMMIGYLNRLEKAFVEEGGIKERMTAARLGYRSDKKEELEAAHREINTLRTRLHQLEQENAHLRQQLSELKRRTEV